MSESANYNKRSYILLIICFSVLIIFYVILWLNTDRNIQNVESNLGIKAENRLLINSESLLFKPEVNEKGEIILTRDDIDKLNKRIEILSSEVLKESNRAESIIDKDLDRLNLYMAIGIGFMTILGIFVPVLVNVLSFQDIRDKLKEQETKQTDQETKQNKLTTSHQSLVTKFDKIDQEKIEKAIEKSKEIDNLTKKTGEIETLIASSFPKVSMLTLQFAIIRFFYLTPYLMTNLIRNKDSEKITSLIDSIKNGFIECKENSSLEEPNLQMVLNDFVIYLEEPKFHSLFINKKITKEFHELSSLITDLVHNKNIGKYQEIDKVLEEIIQSIQNYNVEIEPTAKAS